MTAIAWAIALAAIMWSVEKDDERAERTGKEISKESRQFSGGTILFFMFGIVVVTIVELF